MIPFVDLKAQHQPLRQEIDRAIAEVIDTTAFTLGPQVAQFERAFASYLGTTHAVGVANGTDALLLALRALELPENSEVILPANSFTATASSVVYAGLRPVFVDVEPDTHLMDLNQVREAITPRTKAIIPVHLYGQCVEMNELMNIAEKNKLAVLEDAAQAHGATLEGKKAGTFAHIAAFSFYPGKNLGACGDAGAVVTKDPVLAQRVREMRDHGQRSKYEHVRLGTNSRLHTLQAAVLNVKLPHLDEWNLKRQENAQAYSERLGRLATLGLPVVRPNRTHVFHLYVVRVPNRDAVKAILEDKGVMCGIHYPVPLHLQPPFASYGYMKGDFPIAEKLATEILSLPLYAELTQEQIQYVCDVLKQAMGQALGRKRPGSRKSSEAQL